MKVSEWFRPPRAVLTLFIALMVMCALALASLGWQVLVQDRAIETQRRQEQIETVADRALSSIEHTLSSADAVVVTVDTKERVEVRPKGYLPFSPVSGHFESVSDQRFAEAEELEFRDRNLRKALEAYRQHAASSDPQIRAEALVRVARVLRRLSQWAGALEAYSQLEGLGAIAIAGMPAELIARAARCATLIESGDSGDAPRQAAALWADLTNTRWLLTAASLNTYLNELQALAPALALPRNWDERMLLARAAEWAFRHNDNGHLTFYPEQQAVTITSERQSNVWRARLIGPTVWNALWTRLESETGVQLYVTDGQGRVVHSAGPIRAPSTIRAASATGLPWSVTIGSVASDPTSTAWTARRRFLTTELVIFGLVVSFGSVLIARAISRELAVSRLQSDFVAAVSHEFRTPLTSIRQLTELLAGGRVESEQQRQRAYEVMLGQSDRLRRLVESLLDFGRMQAKEYQFRCDTWNAAHWVHSVVEEFQQTASHRIDLTVPAQNSFIHGDREALSGALWNLLDNAVKYSPGSQDIFVALSVAQRKVEVAVRDHGTGIASGDLKRIFTKFYRGYNARLHGTKGTGIGLAMVKEVVEAHGGVVRVRSQQGQGSEFTMVLPCHES